MSDPSAEANPARFSSDQITYLRPNRLLALSPFALLASPMLFAVATAGHAPLLAILLPFVLLAGVFGTAWGRYANRWPGRVGGKLVAGPKGVSLDGARLASRARIKSGLVVPRGLYPPLVRLDRGLDGPLDLEVRDEAEGRALLRALGFDASQTTATFRTPSLALTDPRYRAFFIVAVVAASFFGAILQRRGSADAAFLRIAVIGAIIALATLSRGRLDVGADGVLTSWMGAKKRFIPYREIKRVSSYSDLGRSNRNRYAGVALELADGDSLHLPVASTSAADCAERVAAAVARIRESMESYQRGEVGASAALLDRGERSPAEWMRSLHAVGAGASDDHRTAPVLPEQLWRIVEDPAQTPELRAGAAVVLRSSLGDEGRARLRAAASAVAEPRVRIAIEAAGGEDEAALEEALGALPLDGARRERNRRAP